MSNLTRKDNSRFILFPIKYPKIWDMFKKAEAAFWTTEEIDLSSDFCDWEKLSNDEKHFISYVLAFFSSADTIVGESLAQKLYSSVSIPEARAFYSFQSAMETIHSETYSILIDSYIKDPVEKEKLFNAIDAIPIVKKKAEWAFKYIESNDISQNAFEKLLVAMACIEGIFFSSSFASIYWLKKRGLMPGLSFSNDLVSLDEQGHVDHGCLLYSMSNQKLSENEVKEIINDAVLLEIEFSTISLPVNLLGINCELMSQYIKFVADVLMQKLGYNKIFNVSNPFDFMEMITVRPKSNFFEVKSNQYSKASVGKTIEENIIKFDAEF